MSNSSDKMVIWALFDSGNGCYKQVGDTMDDVEIFSIGLDIENTSFNSSICKTNHQKLRQNLYVNLDLYNQPLTTDITFLKRL